MTVDPHYLPTYEAPFSPTTNEEILDEEKAEYNYLVQALRQVQESVTRSRPSHEVSRQASLLLHQASELLGDGVEESVQLSGRLWSVPGRAQAFSPVFHIEEVEDLRAVGHVNFGRFHGGAVTAHGGAIPLVYDEILGRLATSLGRPFARTAYLNVDYRAGVPLDTRIETHAWIEHVEGRKVLLRGEMRLGARLLTECKGLWVQIQPQPNNR